MGYIDEWETWHAEREADLSSPHGWLSLVSIDWLDDAPFESALVPGRWWVSDSHVKLLAQSGSGLTIDGAPVAGEVDIRASNDPVPSTIRYGDLQVEVVLRGGNYALRVRDPQSPTRQAFTGAPAYPVDERWRVPALYRRYAEPRPMSLGAVVSGLEHPRMAIGAFHFTVDGRELALVCLDGSSHGPSINFRDETSGRETYGAGRLLEFDGVDVATVTYLDFNRAINLPCAFSDYCTCPVPPPENVLPVPIAAGELAPHRG